MRALNIRRVLTNPYGWDEPLDAAESRKRIETKRMFSINFGLAKGVYPAMRVRLMRAKPLATHPWAKPPSLVWATVA
jgi:hypothetical protein